MLMKLKVCLGTGSLVSCSMWRYIFILLDKHTLYLQHSSKDGIRALILLPTRELAAQTARECKKLARGKKFYIKLMTKQLVKSADFSKLHCDILISTPYRVQFAVRKKKLDLSRCVIKFRILQNIKWQTDTVVDCWLVELLSWILIFGIVTIFLGIMYGCV